MPHARAACKLEGTGYEHLQFLSKSVLPFNHLYNLATCYYHARVRLIVFVTRVTNIHFLLKITSCWGILLSAPFETSFYNNWMTSRALIGRELCSIMVFDNTMCWIYARSDWSLPWSIWGQILGWRHRKLVFLCLCLTWRAVLKTFVSLCFVMWKPPKKEQELFTKTKNGDNKMERVLEVLKISLVEDA